jgi:hypothetical protein
VSRPRFHRPDASWSAAVFVNACPSGPAALLLDSVGTAERRTRGSTRPTCICDTLEVRDTPISRRHRLRGPPVSVLQW